MNYANICGLIFKKTDIPCRLSERINDSYHLILLIELASCCIRLGLAMYILLLTLDTDTVAAFNMILYCVVQLVWLYLYCYLGEQLVYEVCFVSFLRIATISD
ncbi:uncharacterized protein LOC143177049 [Calliopsis andreniformis]|uniref:uncharacterized protein LOC143177049 n=1 Tax=Calliopsis andreniformis TaxID=337506 RepID=UPI003FCE7D4D